MITSEAFIKLLKRNVKLLTMQKPALTALDYLLFRYLCILSTTKEVEMDTIQFELKEEEAIPFERIPGLAYTHEERMESLRQAEENIAAGKITDWEEVKKEMTSW